MRLFLLALTFLAAPALAAEPALRPSARLLFKQPELLQPGQCVLYQEGGSGWIITEPVFYLKGKVVATDVRTRHLGRCPLVEGKNIEQYSRVEFNRLAMAYPCVSATVPEHHEQLGMVRLRVDSWETPHARKAANAGRLYRGMFIDTVLQKGMEIELEADLLGICEK